MSSSFAKSKLKASRDAIQAKRWSDALEAADAALEHEADNYNALVFKGLALLNLERYDESEGAYRAAARAQPESPLAWQGLEKFYKQRKNATGVQECLEEQMRLFAQSQDAGKLAEAIQRLVELQREEGSSAQVAAALELYLESSPYHSLLSTLPTPDQSNPTATSTFEAQLAVHQKSLDVLSEVMALTEAVEEATVAREVEKRRTRLDSAGKTRAALRDEIGAELWGNSKLPSFYEMVLAHPSASDQARRQAELKLLQHWHKLLLSLPNPRAKLIAPTGTAAADDKTAALDAQALKSKNKARQHVEQIARGMVTIGIAEEIAWEVDLEWTDYGSLEELPRDVLRTFIDKFPRSGRTLSFRALLTAVKDEQYLEDEAQAAERNDVEQSTPDPLALAIRALEDAPQSIIVHRIASTMYLLDRDYVSAADVASAGLALVNKVETSAGVELAKTRISVECTLAGALTRLHPPQNHAKALRLLEGVLVVDSANTDALIAKASIEAASARWDEARKLFVRVEEIARDAPNVSPLCFSPYPGVEAKSEIAWCDVNVGRLDQGKQALDGVLDLIEGEASPVEASSEDKAQAWWRLGSCLWQMGGEQKSSPENAFTCFVTALKRSPGYAPAFTSLGFYYEEVANDASRASKCFQKAFELDAREDRAAKELAIGFANDREWDLVDVVARRVVEGEGGANALGGALASLRKHISRNAWAWKAVGSVELERGNFDRAIEALHVALRTQPDDASAWQRLGEAYAGSERYAAALKAFHKAQQLAPQQWAVRYSIAEIHRDLGEMYEALAIFTEILRDHSNEVGVVVAAAETSLLLARQQVAGGYVLRAEQSLGIALAHCINALSSESRLRSGWKIAADSVLELSRLSSAGKIREAQGTQLMVLLDACKEEPIDASLPDVTVCQRAELLQSSGEAHVAAKVAAFLCKLRVVSAPSDEQAEAWSDLAIALQHLYRVTHVPAAAEQATACIKQALRLQPETGRFWMVLGNLSFLSNVAVAQHSYIRAAEAAPQDALPWCYLGLLYLQHDDLELANQALIKAQTLDPDLPQAWAGQAHIARRHNDMAASRVLFAHAVSLSESSCLEADYGFASSVFSLLSSAVRPSKTQLHAPAFSLSVLLAFMPDDISALHLSALFCEQLGEYELATQRITRAALLLEGEYEKDEKPLTATKYAISQANLGRIRLAIGDAHGAVEALEAALGLFDVGQDDAASGALLDGEKRILIRVAAHLGLALAHYLLQDSESETSLASAQQEIEGLEAEETKARLHAKICIERVRLNVPSSDSYEGATADLLDCVNSVPNNLDVLGTLAAIGMVDEDDGLVEGAVSELTSMDLSIKKSYERGGDIDMLLALIDLAEEPEKVDAALSRLRDATMSETPASIESHLTYTEILVRVAASSEKKDRADEAYLAAQKAFALVNSTEGGEQHYDRSMRLLALSASMSGADQAPGEVDGMDPGSTQLGSRAAAPSDLGQRALHAAPSAHQNWRTAAFVRA